MGPYSARPLMVNTPTEGGLFLVVLLGRLNLLLLLLLRLLLRHRLGQLLFVEPFQDGIEVRNRFIRQIVPSLRHQKQGRAGYGISDDTRQCYAPFRMLAEFPSPVGHASMLDATQNPDGFTYDR